MSGSGGTGPARRTRPKRLVPPATEPAEVANRQGSSDGGATAIRGFLIQALGGIEASLLPCAAGPRWTSMTFEPRLEGSDKVDILWVYEDGSRLAEQVKSTAREFRPRDVRGWASDLRAWKHATGATRYQLTLAGPAASARLQAEIPDVRLHPISNDVEQLKIQASVALERFLTANGLETGDLPFRLSLVATLESELLLRSQDKSQAIADSWTPERLLAVLKAAISACGGADPEGARLVALVEERAQSITRDIDDIAVTFQAAAGAEAGAAIVQLHQFRQRFVELHEKHVAAIRAKELTLTHELNREVNELLSRTQKLIDSTCTDIQCEVFRAVQHRYIDWPEPGTDPAYDSALAEGAGLHAATTNRARAWLYADGVSP